MTQSADTAVATADSFERVGKGLNVYESTEVVEGVVKWLDSPEDVIAFVADGNDVSDVVVVARGGTTTFLTMALNAGVRAVVTLQGAPESHLGIVTREYGIPCLMSVSFDKGVRTSRGETVPADGTRVRLDVSSRPEGFVSVEPGAPVDDSPAPEAAGPAMTPEQMEQIQLLLTKFLGQVPHGPEGTAVMEAELQTRVMYVDDDTMQRELTPAEVNEAIRYYTWNEWDALSSRATEGESGLIPRQEYEAMGIMNCWFQHPEWLAAIEERVGAEGLVELGAAGRREIGTKVNMLHLWAMATAPSFGRGIALELNLHDLEFKADRIRRTFERVRRLYKGFWGDGPILCSMREFAAPVLDRSWVDRFAADRLPLNDDASRNGFRRFQAAAELMGFLLHFDNRLGVSDHGPYRLDDGGFILARDIFLNEPAFPWSGSSSTLPHAVTVAMFFDADADIHPYMTDISTVFTTPANYFPYVRGVAVYERQAWDTPVDQVRTLTFDDMADLRDRCDSEAAALYARIAAMSKREKIEAGAMVYTAGFALPFARLAGMVDELAADQGFFEIHPVVSACYETIISGVATEMIPRLFLTGSWGNPVPDVVSDELAAGDTELRVLHALKVRGFATPDAVAESSGVDAATAATVLDTAVERGHAKQRTGRITGYSLTPAGRARHLLLLRDDTTAERHSAVDAAYAAFLAPNQRFKQLTTAHQLQEGGDAPDTAGALRDVDGEVTALLDTLVPAAPRYATYGPRLARARDAFLSGDDSMLAAPMKGSYHDVWMELHEDLLSTLGRERSDDDG